MIFTLEKLKPTVNRNKKDISKSLSIHDPLWLAKTFNAKSYILFSAAGPHFADYSPSAKTSILSAFVTAVKASGYMATPVFFAYAVVSDVGRLKDVTGFQMFKKVCPETRDIVRCSRYESYLYDKVSPKHELFFFDGLRKIFCKKLAMSATYSLIGGSADDEWTLQQNYALSPENYRITAVNSYLYRMADFKASLLESVNSNSSAHESVISRVVFSTDFHRLLSSLSAQNHSNYGQVAVPRAEAERGDRQRQL